MSAQLNYNNKLVESGEKRTPVTPMEVCSKTDARINVGKRRAPAAARTQVWLCSTIIVHVKQILQLLKGQVMKFRFEEGNFL